MRGAIYIEPSRIPVAETADLFRGDDGSRW